MPLQLPTLAEARGLSRDAVSARLVGYSGAPSNNRARVLADANGALAFEAFQYLDELAVQFLPDTATGAALDRWANIFLSGRNAATYASGVVAVTGIAGSIIPADAEFSGPSGVLYAAFAQTTVGSDATGVPVHALTPGSAGNVAEGASFSLTTAVAGVDASAIGSDMTGGVDVEDDDSLRDRVLARIRKPPMGGDADDYVAWARAVPGVTRAWCSPNEMGPGTVSVRFMMDELRADQDGFPTPTDVAAMQTALDLNRPVAVKDCFALAPLPEEITFTVANLSPDSPSIRANIATSVAAMLNDRAAPARSINGVRVEAQAIYREWVSAAVLAAEGVSHFDLVMDDHPMPYNGAKCIAKPLD